MRITIEDIRFDVEETENGYALSIPDNKFGPYAGGILFLLSKLPTSEEHLPSEKPEVSDDVFEALEAEMANDTVRDSVALHLDMQDMVAERTVTALMTDPDTPVELAEDDLTELSRWFARCQHTLAAMEGDGPTELRLISNVWSVQLLELTV